MRASSRASGLAANLLVLAGAAALALVALEIALRVLPLGDPSMTTAFQNPPWETWADPAWGNPGPETYRPDTTIGYEHAPSVDVTVRVAAHASGAFRFHTNCLGLRRDAETALAKPTGTRRVLVLGDSHTDGYVDNGESFSTLLEARLASRADAGSRSAIEVLNAGVVGYSPAQEYLWYAAHGAALAPDVVVLVLYVGNDIAELSDPSKPGVDPETGRGIPASEAAPPGTAGPGRFGPYDRLDRLRVVAWSRAAIRFGPLAPLWRRLGLPGAVRAVGDFRTEILSEVLRTCHGCFWQSLQQAARYERHPDETRTNVARVAAIARALDRRVGGDGGRLVVAVLPTRAQVEPERAGDERAWVATLLGLAPASLAFEDEATAELVRRLGDAGLTVVPLVNSLRQAAASAGQYYERDWHLAPPGHRTVAAALEDAVVKTFQLGPAQASR